MRRPAFLFGLLCCLAGSFASPQQAKDETDVIPGFKIALSYSPRASSELKRRGETIVIFGYTYGAPTKGAPRKLVSDMGELGLGDLHAETGLGEIVEIRKLKVDRDKLRYIDSAGIQVLINVVSGRKSSPNNLLNCGIYEGPLQDIQNTTISLACKLIGEP